MNENKFDRIRFFSNDFDSLIISKNWFFQVPKCTILKRL